MQQQTACISVRIFQCNAVKTRCFLLYLKIIQFCDICTHLGRGSISGSSEKFFQVMVFQINISNVLLAIYSISHTKGRGTIHSVCGNCLVAVMLAKLCGYLSRCGIQVVIFLVSCNCGAVCLCRKKNHEKQEN